MKKTISVYWPLAVVASLATLAYLNISSHAASRASQTLDANHLTAELARAVSYGIIDAAALTAKPLPDATAMPVAEAS